MKGLIFSTAGSESTYTTHLRHHPTFTTLVVNSVKDALSNINASPPDFILLEYNIGEKACIEEIAAFARSKQFEGPILIYREMYILNIAPQLYEFIFDDTLQATELVKIIHLLRKNIPARRLKGMLLLAESFFFDITEKFSYILHKIGFEIIPVEDIAMARSNIQENKVDFIVIHCHTKYGDFESVRLFSEFIHTTIPDCVIMITCNESQLDHYDDRHQIRSFKYDYLMDSIIIVNTIISQVIEGKYKKIFPQQKSLQI
ncbi:hypothetical protein GFS24_08025 [Chitinophaga sp. SYP-B3965]|uniref:hypothetical protein n=1 Tax=Chitinophaga sp. SYP-B3965 TaxID=2663120 RepID=UPI0012997CAD|nr:hypothetical protein [Chitinophaga sp. SYP-B3965]MRG45058.1 hypothetical protein [Chitinophaga sp. SYP-B3965]